MAKYEITTPTDSSTVLAEASTQKEGAEALFRVINSRHLDRVVLNQVVSGDVVKSWTLTRQF
jgi:hypothetical protein